MQSVNSSSIVSAGWEPPDTLFLEFVGGEVYQYSGISRETFTTLLGSSSPGGYFHRSIRPFSRGERV
jgi:hypothetical protein